MAEKVLRAGDIFYCRTMNDNMGEFIFRHVDTNKPTTYCRNCKNKGSRFCCKIIYSPAERPAKRLDACMHDAMETMSYNKIRTDRVRYVENIFEPSDVPEAVMQFESGETAQVRFTAPAFHRTMSSINNFNIRFNTATGTFNISDEFRDILTNGGTV